MTTGWCRINLSLTLLYSQPRLGAGLAVLLGGAGVKRLRRAAPRRAAPPPPRARPRPRASALAPSSACRSPSSAGGRARRPSPAFRAAPASTCSRAALCACIVAERRRRRWRGRPSVGRARCTRCCARCSELRPRARGAAAGLRGARRRAISGRVRSSDPSPAAPRELRRLPLRRSRDEAAAASAAFAQAADPAAAAAAARQSRLCAWTRASVRQHAHQLRRSRRRAPSPQPATARGPCRARVRGCASARLAAAAAAAAAAQRGRRSRARRRATGGCCRGVPQRDIRAEMPCAELSRWRLSFFGLRARAAPRRRGGRRPRRAGPGATSDHPAAAAAWRACQAEAAGATGPMRAARDDPSRAARSPFPVDGDVGTCCTRGRTRGRNLGAGTWRRGTCCTF